jgi:uncharacterized membrane protein
MKKVRWIVFAVVAVIVGLYPGIYFIINRKFGLLGTKSNSLLNDTLWNINFYTHIILGGIALLIGWLQFNKQLRNNKPEIHRTIGKVYIICVLISAVAGIYIGWFATGGWITSTAFITLGIIWFYTTSAAFIAIKKGQVLFHEKLMIFSYAATFGAVTLRIWLPTMVWITGDFFVGYPIAAWLAFVPNMIVAYFITRAKPSLS